MFKKGGIKWIVVKEDASKSSLNIQGAKRKSARIPISERHFEM
jgi:hypothetical protein